MIQDSSPRRCAIYTRKSTEEGLDQAFNTLQAQREAAEAYIASQGWKALPQPYDDGGYTGGNIERPALQRLLADIRQGRIDCVVVYKVDRLSRSLLDFARMMDTFERHGVAFVAVTQEFNTATSMGRLMLNVLLSFAQFERELISERTRDKMGAARRKGKWLGSMPVLGYDVDREARKLVVHEEEARRVREIFAIYLKTASLRQTVQELHRRRWRNKRWTTRKGSVRGGKPFNKSTLQYLLTNVTYTGQVCYQGRHYPGEQDAIVDKEVFQEAQCLLHENRVTPRKRSATRWRGILHGKLFCAGCDAAMTHTYTRKSGRRYRYYVCSVAQKQGYDRCDTRAVPAAQIEKYVIGQLRDHLAARGTAAGALDPLTRRVLRVEYDGRSGDMRIEFATDEEEGPS